MKKTIVLILTIIFLFSAVLAGCASKTTAEPTKTPEAMKAPEATKEAEATAKLDVTKEVVYKDSPFLAGKGLPPVKDRLPKEPKLSNPLPADQIKYEIGTYGGVVRTVTAESSTFDALVFCMQNTPLLNSPGLLGKEVTPNVLKAYEVTSDQKEFTFHLREGLKWSDGQPVTTDDFKFAIEDVLMNKELSPAGLPSWLLSGGVVGGTPVVFEVQDQFTFTMKFDKPYGGFPLTLSIESWRGYTDLLKPKHFMSKYHTKYVPLAQLEPLIKEAKFKPGEWTNLFNFKDCLNLDSTAPKAIGFPALTPWLLMKKTENVSDYERNPYYLKVDEAGNQLPYIDKVQSTYVTDPEMIVMKVLGGEVDHSSELLSAQKLELLKQNEAKGGYKMYLPKLHRTGGDIMLNLTYKDDNWRKVVHDLRFRQALNFALDRPEIVSTVYNGIAKPSTFQGTDFNLVAGNKLLDDMGMKKGADGFRIGPDSKKFTIPFDCAPFRPEIMATAQIVVEQLRLLGLDVPLKQIDVTLWSTRNAANELKATIDYAPGPVMWTRPEWHQSTWAPLWTQWIASSGKLGEEPPADFKKFINLVNGLRALSLEDANKQADAIRADMKTNLWFFILADDIAEPTAINAKMRNYTNNGFNIAQFFGAERWFYAK